jgi:hypothetical protein
MLYTPYSMSFYLKMNKLINISIIWFALLASNFSSAQNASVNGVVIGGNQDNVISKPCAIIIKPTNKEINQLTKKEGGDSTQASNDNANLSVEIIKSYLDSTNTPIIEKEAKGELKFKLIDGKTYNLHLDKLYWDIFLFNGENTPIKVTAIDFEQQYINYMKIEK